MLKKLWPLVFFLVSPNIFAQIDVNPQKYALVIGNGSYRDLNRLANPVNDADDMTLALEYLGFTVEKLLNGNLEQMEEAVTRLRDNLKVSGDAYGFFFYAGHGVQSGGENFLIPVNANIPSESYLRNRALSVQIIIDDLNEAGNSLNVVVLDACRDNPFSWGRSGGNRGLAIISRQPADSIIVYATSAGQQASDGEGRNGLFTSQLLPNLVTPGLEVSEVFKRTGADVSRESSNRQIPAIYSQFFGTAWLGVKPDETGTVIASVQTLPWQQPGAVQSRTEDQAARLWTLGASVGTSFSVPWLIGTIHGTIAPFRYSFLEIGFDAGLISGRAKVDYYSISPYLHYAFFMPFEKGGFYAGAGGGYMFAQYKFPEDDLPINIFMANVIVGINLWDTLDISYTLRTNFKNPNHKVSVGYVRRFM